MTKNPPADAAQEDFVIMKASGIVRLIRELLSLYYAFVLTLRIICFTIDSTDNGNITASII